jgi:hypothetical protein
MEKKIEDKSTVVIRWYKIFNFTYCPLVSASQL